jgi:hypothetical protein
MPHKNLLSGKQTVRVLTGDHEFVAQRLGAVAVGCDGRHCGDQGEQP